MTAHENRSYELTCNGTPGRYCREVVAGENGESRAALRRRAGKAGWTHARVNLGRKFDRDYCPACKPAGEDGSDLRTWRHAGVHQRRADPRPSLWLERSGRDARRRDNR